MNARVLLTGATGFVGRYLYPALREAGYEVRCATRDVERSRRLDPARQWVRFDLEQPDTIRHALEDCTCAYYLVHGMAGGAGYPEREARAAALFRDAAADAGVRRIIYLGGVAPHGTPSRHLQSRLKTGAILRGGTVPAVELRAAMVIGMGSASWQMLRDLAVRLPAMVLPRWLRNHSWPIAVEDVVFALIAALELPDEGAGWYDLPGPDRLSHRDLLTRVAKHVGHRPPMVAIPVLTPRLSSYWIALVTRADLHLAGELVEGLRYELDPTGAIAWQQLPPYTQTPVDRAISYALTDQRSHQLPSPMACERMAHIGRRFYRPKAA